VFARVPERELGSPIVAGRAGDWREVCEAAAAATDAEALRSALMAGLRPWSVRDREETEGLFTGYYEPSLAGSRRRDARFRYPLYRRPPELVEVDHGSFRDDLRGRRVAGRVDERRLVPYADRAALDAGARGGRGLELVWVDDPVAAFFLHIQGSGRVELQGGGHLRIGYDGQNGHPYTAIGRELVARGELALEEVSMQSIRAWLEAHPDQAVEVMHTNRSFVFFRELGDEGPVGSQGVVLTPRRSLAIDRSFLPLGVPLWLDTTLPVLDVPEPAPAAGEAAGAAVAELTGPPLRRLYVAQDTGGAIRGPVRGDVFWGHGAEAEAVAGRMRQSGRLWLLLPVAVEPAPELRLDPGAAGG
ncbi:MAG: MltA domain-containing protein, partial [Thermoanaerobaculia bacterium]|nr:MltA domain-containing protein [Thermoanaerobaculia bacterium]